MRFEVALLLPCLAAITLQAAETNLTFTVDGITYSNVTFGTLTPLAVNIHHSAGIAKVPLAKLPAELQQRLGYDPQKAADWQKAEEQRAMLGKLSKTFLNGPLKVGMLGVSVEGRVVTIQITGPADMIAWVFVGRDWGTTRPLDIYGQPSAGYNEKVWIKGISTKGLTDDEVITRNDVFKVTGTKTYPTAAGGTATIFVLEPLASVSTP